MFGQAVAIEKVQTALQSYGWVKRSNQTAIASYLFTGLTGVGKTELAKRLHKQ